MKAPVLTTPPAPAALLAALDVAAFDPEKEALRLRTEPPAWLVALWPGAAIGEMLPTEERFFFLDHFLEDAETFWEEGAAGALTSEVWTEEDNTGRIWLLHALALWQEDRPIFLIRPAAIDPQIYQGVLQESRVLNLELHRLRKAADRREVMLHCIVHDLTTPLSGIRGCLELLYEDDLVLEEDGNELLFLGLRQVEKMRDLIQEVLASFGKEGAAAAARGVDVQTVAEEVAAALGPLATVSDAQLRVEAPAEGHWRTVGDARRLERILFNLVENAIRHTAPGTEVVVRLRDEGGAVWCGVADNGGGVPDALAPRLFRKFVQGGDKQGKVGLGLYFCRITVEGWGGTIGYQPAAGGGACFWFRLPRVPQR